MTIALAIFCFIPILALGLGFLLRNILFPGIAVVSSVIICIYAAQSNDVAFYYGAAMALFSGVSLILVGLKQALGR